MGRLNIGQVALAHESREKIEGRALGLCRRLGLHAGSYGDERCLHGSHAVGPGTMMSAWVSRRELGAAVRERCLGDAWVSSTGVYGCGWWSWARRWMGLSLVVVLSNFRGHSRQVVGTALVGSVEVDRWVSSREAMIKLPVDETLLELKNWLEKGLREGWQKLGKIFNVLGDGTDEVWQSCVHLPDYNRISFSKVEYPIGLEACLKNRSPDEVLLVKRLLYFDPANRATAMELLNDKDFGSDSDFDEFGSSLVTNHRKWFFDPVLLMLMAREAAKELRGQFPMKRTRIRRLKTTSPTHVIFSGIIANLMMKVFDPNNINAIEIPVKSKPKAAGENWGDSGGGEEEDGYDDNREKSGNEISSGGMWRAWMAIAKVHHHRDNFIESIITPKFPIANRDPRRRARPWKPATAVTTSPPTTLPRTLDIGNP
ncbi:cyclin-dependent kinase F-1 [Striga asiatica]|uniref:Cyclin-dependent kinase F-1 n=1 Tax=Striga asiatica TaxID=4170 RepID=A0A5A7PZL2_STRAF|nr:cyclin-dependent kinase F-1 [Striga asiatica]